MRKIVVVTRTVTVTSRIPAGDYRDWNDTKAGGKPATARQMSDEEIRDYELKMEVPDQCQAIDDAMSSLPPERIDLSCTVAFEEVPDEQAD